MDKEILLRKLTELVDEAERTHLYGSIEIEFRAGKPTFIRRHIDDKLDEQTQDGRPRAKQAHR